MNWKGWPKRVDDWTNNNRAKSLLLVVVGVLATVAFLEWASTWSSMKGIIGWISARPFFGPLLFPDTPPEWKERLNALIPLIGLPVAFLLWHWRDRNVLAQIQKLGEQVKNARKDTNLKEFQEVQLRAAGALDKDLPPEAREQLQIAALHQLRIFLEPNQPESFRRAAFELLLAGHASAMQRIGVEAVRLSLESIAVAQLSDQIRSERSKLQSKLTKADSARMLIIEDEWKAIFESPFPMTNRNFDLLNFHQLKVPAGVNFLGSSFFGTMMVGATLENICFNSTKMEGAALSSAKLNGSSFSSACLDAANFSSSEMRSITMCIVGLEGLLPGASLRAANFVFADLLGGNLTDSDTVGANFHRATLDEVIGLPKAPHGSVPG